MSWVPFYVLQERQARTRLSIVLGPPREVGMMCSHSSGPVAPQYAQTWPFVTSSLFSRSKLDGEIVPWSSFRLVDQRVPQNLLRAAVAVPFLG